MGRPLILPSKSEDIFVKSSVLTS
ncbi:hypothetical protein B4U80_05021 [Leptotrombidium deliense]|uniref:Uncharacterized protein n=1 Tax=Leptotrombidium deliense TaxID=299467 RepID=A0A443QF65_9ACAR|nr:hypothetical protein B4U80_05021 [Leptotrombidium deliense]